MSRIPCVLAVLCAAGGFVAIAIPGLRFTGFLLLCLAFLCAALALLGRHAKTQRAAHVLRNVLLALLCVGCLCFAALETLVISGVDNDVGGEDVSSVVILGAGVYGTKPSLMLRVRLDAALAYIADKPDIPIIVSGCQGNGEDITEAECMYRYLIARGVDAGRIWKEERATSTRTNFAYSMELMAERGIDPTDAFAYVTNDFHIYRAGIIAGVPWAHGIAARLPRSSYYDVLEVNYFVREAFALANELLFRMDLDL